MTIDGRLSLLEQLVENPTQGNFQDTLTVSVEEFMLDLKRDIEQSADESGNFDARMEALLGVPLDRSQTMTFAGSPLLQAMEKNFNTFHPPGQNAGEIPEATDGASQLGAVLSERGGAIILNDHSQAKPIQFIHDSLPEIASHGSAVILIENAGDFDSPGVINPIEAYYASGDSSHLDVIKSTLTARAEQVADTRALAPEEQAILTELQARDKILRETIIAAHDEQGIRAEFYGGSIEAQFSAEFGTAARVITTNYSWDDDINSASERYDNVIVYGGAAHFFPNIEVEAGQNRLDESLGFPTFSLANPGGQLRECGDYNLVPSTTDGRWVPIGDDHAAPEQDSILDMGTPCVAPGLGR